MARRSAARRPSARDTDAAWKTVLHALLPDYVAFALPALHAAIDWSRPIRPLETELRAVLR